MVTVFLQVSLPLLKQCLLEISKVLVLVVTISIGPLKHVSALNDHLAAVFQEFKLFRRVALEIVELVHLVADDGE